MLEMQKNNSKISFQVQNIPIFTFEQKQKNNQDPWAISLDDNDLYIQFYINNTEDRWFFLIHKLCLAVWLIFHWTCCLSYYRFFPAMIFNIVNPATPTEQEGTNTVHIAFGNMSK